MAVYANPTARALAGPLDAFSEVSAPASTMTAAVTETASAMSSFEADTEDGDSSLGPLAMVGGIAVGLGRTLTLLLVPF